MVWRIEQVVAENTARRETISVEMKTYASPVKPAPQKPSFTFFPRLAAIFKHRARYRLAAITRPE
jgi:hypothetical protein